MHLPCHSHSMVAQCDKEQVRGGICATGGCKLDAIMPFSFFLSARDTSQDRALNDKTLKNYTTCALLIDIRHADIKAGAVIPHG